MTDEIPQLQGSPRGYAAAERVVLVEKKSKKISENLLTNQTICDIIQIQMRSGKNVWYLQIRKWLTIYW